MVYDYALSYGDCSYRVYQSFTKVFTNVLVLLILHFPIHMALCLMHSMTYYAQNYAGIIGGSLITWVGKLKSVQHVIICIPIQFTRLLT